MEGGRIRRLDGLRWIAAFLVFLSHSVPATLVGNQPWGRFAVLFFFVLSGYLITKSLVTSWDRMRKEKRRPLQWALSFYVRRSVRIIPPMVLVLMCLRTFFREALQPVEGQYWFFMANLSIYWNRMLHPASAHLWSIAVEEQFYLIWPALIWLGYRLTRDRKERLSYFGFVFLFGVWMRWKGLEGSLYPPYRELLMPMLFEAFVLGGLVWILDLKRHKNLSIWLMLGSAFMFTLAACLVHMGGSSSRLWVLVEIRHQAVLLFSAACILWACLPNKSWVVDRLLLSRSIQYSGRISYGFYLYHVPVLFVLKEQVSIHWLAMAAIALPFSWGLAALSYECMERPLIYWAAQRKGFRPCG